MSFINVCIEWIKNIQVEQLIDILVAILIFIVFKFLSKRLAYLTLKIMDPKKSKREIKNKALFQPLKALYTLLGLYFAIISLKITLPISDKAMTVINKLFKISLIIIIAKIFTNTLTSKGKLANILREQVKPDMQDPMFNFLIKIVNAIIYIIAGFLVFEELGLDLSGLVTGLGIGTVVITLAAQDTAKSLFGGLVIFLDKPFLVGEWIQIGEYEGIVEDITFRSTRIRTFENSLLNIPNAVVADSSIINWSKMQKRRNRVNLCIDMNTPLEKLEVVQKRIKNMLLQRDHVLSDDTIIVRFDEIADNGYNLLVYNYVSSTDYESFIKERENINFKIMKILQEENVELAYDTKTVYVKN